MVLVIVKHLAVPVDIAAGVVTQPLMGMNTREPVSVAKAIQQRLFGVSGPFWALIRQLRSANSRMNASDRQVAGEVAVA